MTKDTSLWDLLHAVKQKAKWVELSHTVSPQTPHWSGFPAMSMPALFTHADGFLVHKFDIVSQYGTHVDAPVHFVPGRRTLDKIPAEEMILPLCVIDVSRAVEKNEDYAITISDILAWEAKYGTIPEHSFVALQTNWSKRDDLDNLDADGNKHYPGWSIEALEYLVEKRNIAAIGHETSDTDPPVISSVKGYIGETYILDKNRYQIELLQNLSEVPATGSIIICGFPRVLGGAGFTARCIAICPR